MKMAGYVDVDSMEDFINDALQCFTDVLEMAEEPKEPKEPKESKESKEESVQIIQVGYANANAEVLKINK